MYTIKSVHGGGYIAGADANPDDRIQISTDSGLSLTVDPSPDPTKVVTTTIYNEKSGLYMGVYNAVPGEDVTWVTEGYQWEVAQIESGRYVISCSERRRDHHDPARCCTQRLRRYRDYRLSWEYQAHVLAATRRRELEADSQASCEQ
jgi:hypothetical protein